MIDLVGGNIPEGKNFHITRRTGFSNRKFSIPLSWIIPREDKGEPCKKKKKKKKNSGKNSLDTAESPELWLLLEQPSARGFECRVWIRFSCGSYQNRSHLRVFRRKKRKKREEEEKKRHFVIAVEKKGGREEDTVSRVMYYLSVCFLRA